MNMNHIESGMASDIAGLGDPRKFYKVLESPAPFAGMAYPSGTPWESLYRAGFRHVVCLTDDVPSYDPRPLEMLGSAYMEDLCGGSMPEDPDREQKNLIEMVSVITDAIHAGEGVVVHCQGGTGRTGTVIACSLRQMGFAIDKILEYMARLNVVRKKHSSWSGWPESDWQRGQVVLWSVS
jgi:hypothetical protein